ncbi:hypothetical protein [Streptomyces sp. TLI_185]|uniref:hypothetical protein n=1 Tax=Streptomyces sp. TLI_185 TaxID=2485151 RepID=UPI000F4DB267|nr:hypothetical protein [Streptomyces sp. TLI_185]
MRGQATDLQARTGGRRLDAAEVVADESSRRTAPAAKQLPALPAGSVDPARRVGTGRSPANPPCRSFRLPGLSVPVEMSAVVVAPTGATIPVTPKSA